MTKTKKKTKMISVPMEPKEHRALVKNALCANMLTAAFVRRTLREAGALKTVK